MLIKNSQLAKSLMERMLGIIKKPIASSVLMHVLICLSYLSKEKF
jgi:hypothetical protein